MEATEKGHKALALGITIAIHALLFLFFIKMVTTTPVPPYPDSGALGIEVNFGNMVEGTGSTEASGMGDVAPSDVNTAKTETSKPESNDSKLLTGSEESSVHVKKTEKTEKNDHKQESTEKNTEQKPSSELEAALNKLRNKKSGSGGDGDSGKEGNEGSKDGDPRSKGGGGYEDGYLPGRVMTKKPYLVDDSNEEGKVVVQIIVNQAGKVIEAIPGARGSTTTSSVLYAKARQAALGTKYNETQEGPEEVRTTITFTFVNN